MTAKTVRKIVTISEEKCNGCGICIPACAEGALKIVNGKARLISEKYCDGLGACLGKCPHGAITVEERVTEEFDEEVTKLHLEMDSHTIDGLPCSCPSAIATQSKKREAIEDVPIEATNQHSMLSHWPVQLALVPPMAPFLQGANVVLAADCVPFAYANFHQDFLKNNSLLVACPKLYDFQAHLKKMIAVLSHSSMKSLTVVHMEVPCCSGLLHMVKQALQLSGKNIPFRGVTIGINGDLKL